MTNAQRKELRKRGRRDRLHESLISPEEAVAISHETLTTEAINRARNVAKASPWALRLDFNDWNTMRALSYVWNAGRIQGIREERRLRK